MYKLHMFRDVPTNFWGGLGSIVATSEHWKAPKHIFFKTSILTLILLCTVHTLLTRKGFLALFFRRQSIKLLQICKSLVGTLSTLLQPKTCYNVGVVAYQKRLHEENSALKSFSVASDVLFATLSSIDSFLMNVEVQRAEKKQGLL